MTRAVKPACKRDNRAVSVGNDLPIVCRLPSSSVHFMVRPMPAFARSISAAWLIAALTLGSRVLGLVREGVLSYYFSTNEILSAFRIAFMVPNLARRLFGEGALSSAMIPILTESLETRGETSSRRFIGTLLVVLAVVLALVILVAEGLIAAWRAIQDDFALELTAVLMPYMGLICMVAAGGAVLNVRRHFAVPAAMPMILNIGIVAGVLVGAVWIDLSGADLMYAACAGVLLAGVVQLATTGIALRHIRFFPMLGGAWRDPQIRAVSALMAPMVLGLSAVQINSLVDYLIAYLFIREDGQRVGPAVLGCAQYLYQLPLGVFGIAIATAIFPVLSQKAAEGDRVGMAGIFGRGIRLSLFIALPASIGLMFVARPLVATLYQRGAFDAGDTQRVAATLFFYSIGIVAYFAQHILVRTFYALHNSSAPARIALCMVGVNFAMNVSLVFILEERGLALATAVCAVVQVIWLSTTLARTLPEIGWRRIGAGALRMLTATGIMATALSILAWSSLADRLVGESAEARLATLVLTGIAIYVVAAKVLRIKELDTVLRQKRRPPAE